MKKITFLFLMLSVFSFTEVFSQSDYYTAIPSDGGTSTNARAPHGRFRYQRGVVLITSDEMTDSGLVSGNIINSIAFNYLTAQNIPTNATMTLYLQNTADTANTKSTTWATAITGMTTVSTGAVTIPSTAGNVMFNFAGGTPFTYTGGAVYVAFDYQNATNPLPTTVATVDCNSNGLTAGFKGGQSDTAVPTALVASSFRPVILLGKQVSCARPFGFSTSAVTGASVTLSFNAGGPVNLEYGPYGFAPGTGTTISNATSPYILSGLNPSMVYDVYGVKVCGVGNLSEVSNAFAFNTTFTAADPTYNTSFEQENLGFIGWATSPVNFSSSWFINIDAVGSPLAQDGAASAVSISNTTSETNTWLLSRGVNLTAGSVATITYYDRNYLGTGSTGSASYVATVGTAQLVDSQTTILSTVNNLSSTTFQQKTLTYTVPTTGVYYFGFHNLSPINVGTQALIIDSFRVTQTLKNSEFLSSKFSVYPNPASNLINFSNNADAAVDTIELADLNGRIVKSVKVNNTTEGQISIGDLAVGVYMMKISTDQGIATKKIVKQ